MKIGLTWDKFADVVKGTWHLIAMLFVLIWYVASYKAALDLHLSTIDEHMRVEDNKLNWLINHHSDKDEMPPDQQQQYIPQAQKVKPQSLLRSWPEFAAEQKPPQDAAIPLLEKR